MTRDYSSFLPSAHADTPTPELSPLERIGWKPFFSQQSLATETETAVPVRVIEVHRSGLRVLGDGIDTKLPPDAEATVGDWLLYDPEAPNDAQLLDRTSLFARRAPGHDRKRQLIAANVDTVFIVSSCNRDFNVARLERYIILAFDADVTPVILLTKVDLCDDPAPYIDEARSISDRVLVEALNAKSDDPTTVLAPWVKPGQTVAFLGSSGVGKSTLVNALFRNVVADTADVRSDDSKGRHTTTRRHLHFTPDGCALLDTPGMRELQLTDVETGIAGVFADIVELTTQCKFNDCSHETEPGCAVRKAVDAGEIDPERLARWAKLAAEDQFNSTTLAERKSYDKALHKRIRAIQSRNRK